MSTAMPPSKRLHHIRRPGLASAAPTTISNEFLKDFPRTLLNDVELTRNLRTFIQLQRASSNPSQEERRIATEIPSKFESAQKYCESFLPFVCEEAKSEIENAMANPECCKRIVWKFVLKTESSEAIKDGIHATMSQNSAQDSPTRICKIKAVDFLVANTSANWKEMENKSVNSYVFPSGDAPLKRCGVNGLAKGEVLILIGQPVTKRANVFESQSPFVHFALVNRAARLVPSAARGVNGNVGGGGAVVELEIALPKADMDRLEGIEFYAYYLSGCNVVTAWREWDGIGALFSSTKQAKFKCPLLPLLLKAEPPPQRKDSISSSSVPHTNLSAASGASSISAASSMSATRPRSQSLGLADTTVSQRSNSPASEDAAKSSLTSDESSSRPPTSAMDEEIFSEKFNIVRVDPNRVMNVPGITSSYQTLFSSRFNPSQLEAIWSASSSSTTEFFLVQGPPGTGKTHTLLGLLGSLHLSANQRCYDKYLPNPNKANNEFTGNFDFLGDHSNPHLLVTAPSNAAIDNVLQLVLSKGFVDGQGGRYDPICVRIGSAGGNRGGGSVGGGSGMGDALHACSLDSKVDELMRLRERGLAQHQSSETDGLNTKLKVLKNELRHHGKKLCDVANDHAQTGNAETLREFYQTAGHWIGMRNLARDLALDLERRRLLFNAGSMHEAAIRSELRSIVLLQANLVFSTLSQCGSSLMTESAPSKVTFPILVVDEAAQAVEPSTLVPLSLGVEKCILVGDPNQLPATVLSDRSMKANYERSLFERLQRCGYPVHLLNMQYRCRPELSAFPSKVMYEGRLQDGPNVLRPEYGLPMHRRRAFGPLVFYDVSHGEQLRNTASNSLSNDAEADICMELYRAIRQTLRLESISPLTQKPAHIAVISPYREQLQLLRSRFQSHFPPDQNLEMNTVDGVQGREVDIVIFSCVRAGDATGIGFLNDARRLNVAITRARFSLFMVGNFSVLNRGSRLWKGFLEHVKKRGTVVPGGGGKASEVISNALRS